MAYKPHDELIDRYIKENHLPYKSNFENPIIKICREFEIISSQGLRRFDLMYINESDKRYDILEFKSRPLLLKDAYQIYGYIKAFVEKLYHGSFDHEYKYCFHLIGRDYEDERIDNIVLVDSPVFKVHVYYDINKQLEVYEQDISNVMLNIVN